MDVKLSSL